MLGGGCVMRMLSCRQWPVSGGTWRLTGRIQELESLPASLPV